MAETRELCKRYEEIARELIEGEEELAHLKVFAPRIAYLSSECAEKHKGKLVFGMCEKVPAKWHWRVPYDFTITVFEPNAAGLDDEKLRILIFHELLHVGARETDEGEIKFSLVPHDVEEFRAIAERFGLDWVVA